jgi:hypothetical protein
MLRMHTELTPDVRDELSRLGVQNVLRKLDQAGVGRGALVDGFDCGQLQRDVIEDWVAQQGREDAKQQQKILFWARVAGWGAVLSIVVTVVLWAIGLKLQK